MKAITLTQPWASLVMAGIKRFETRSWSTNHVGPLLIHAARGFPEQCKRLCYEPPFQRALSSIGYPDQQLLPTGVLLGYVTLIGCWRIPRIGLGPPDLPPVEPERSFGDYTDGRFAWMLSRPVWLPRPVPYRGRLGLYEVDLDKVMTFR